jgi:3-oxoacyl-[acyl-carrier protein] reductase
MNLDLGGHVALVTGSSSGIGAVIAQVLAAEGASVVVHGRNEKLTHAVADAIVAEGGRAAAIAADLSTDGGAESLATAAADEFGCVDILVNNVGAYANTSWTTATGEDWLAVYNTNVVSAVRLIRLLVPPMKAAGWGRVVQISSGEGARPFPNMPDYAATKAAMNNLTVSLAQELTATGITVNTVSPGIIVTAGVETFYRQMATERGWGNDWSAIEAGVLAEVLGNDIGRLGRPEEVANLVAFVVSPLAGYICGANLRVDGGASPTVN